MICTNCKEDKTEDLFSKAPTKLGYKKKCKSCVAEYYRNYFASDAEKAAKQRARVADYDKGRKKVRYRHGLDESDYEKLVARHEGLCWACKVNKGTDIDHDHSCCPQVFSCGDCVRGFLCSACNTSLGLLREDVDRIQALALYLEDTKGR
jgi:hypothetical protein